MKLLRVLQQGELERVGGRETIHVDVRVVAGTQRDLAEEIRAGTFRDDLYYRLNVVSLALPPLRARKSDIPALVAHFLATSPAADARGSRGDAGGALALFGYDWPGNVRELASVVERAVAVAEGPGSRPTISLRCSRAAARTSWERSRSSGASLFEIEREAILRTLEQVGGSTARAARSSACPSARSSTA